MKICNQAILLAVVALGLGACSVETPWSSSEGEGGISLKLSVSADVKDAIPVLRSGAPVLEVPDIANFGVSLTNLSTTEVQSYPTLADFQAVQSFREATYTLAAFYGNANDEGFEKPYFYGETEVNVIEGKNAEAEVTATLANSMVSVDYTDGFKAYFPAYEVTIHSEGHDYITFEETESRPAFVVPGEIAIAVNVTNPSGKSVTIQPASFAAEAKHHYHITFDVNTGTAGQAQLQVVFDDSVEEEDVTIDLTDELFTSPGPEITTSGFADGGTIEVLSGNAVQGDPLKFDIVAHGGISSAVLTISGEGFTPSFGNEIDLANATAEQQKAVENLGIKVLGLYKNPGDMAYVDVTGLPQHLPEGIFEVALMVKDNFTRASAPAKLNISTKPVNISAAPGAIVYGVNEATLYITYNGSDPEKNFSFTALDENGHQKPAAIKSVKESTRTRNFEDKEYIFTIELPDTEQRIVTVEVLFNGENRASLDIPVTVPQYSIEADAFAKYAKLKVNPENASELAAIVNSLRLYLNGNRVAESNVSRNNESGIIIITGLNPATSYTFGAGLQGKAAEKTVETSTEATTDVPNGDFSQTHETIKRDDVEISGKYSFTVGYQAHVTMQRSEATGWSSINAKTCWFECPGAKNTWFQVPSTFAENGVVVLRNVAYDHNGVKPADMTTGIGQTHWYNTNVPTFTTAAAGEVFLGSYSFDGSEHREDGISFASRPTSISFEYTYVPEGADKGDALISLVDDANNIIASASMELTSNSSMKSCTLPLSSYKFGAKASKLIVRFASSNSNSVLNFIHIPSGSELDEGHHSIPINYGNTADQNRGVNDYHALATGSVLTIDNVKLNY